MNEKFTRNQGLHTMHNQTKELTQLYVQKRVYTFRPPCIQVTVRANLLLTTTCNYQHFVFIKKKNSLSNYIVEKKKVLLNTLCVVLCAWKLFFTYNGTEAKNNKFYKTFLLYLHAAAHRQCKNMVEIFTRITALEPFYKQPMDVIKFK